MIPLLLAMLLQSPSEAATTREVVAEVQGHTELCREGLRHWNAGDADWMEREMGRLHFTPERKQARRILCLYYLQGAMDLQTQLGIPNRPQAPQKPQERGKAI